METQQPATTDIVEEKTVSRFWRCRHTWRRSAHNTKWCLIGCSIGDFGTIAFFQFTGIPWPTLAIMALAIVNGLLTSIALETIILKRNGMDLSNAFRTAIGMSMISMVGMELAMNLTDWFFTGGAILTWWVVPIMLAAGFLAPWPYNYWRLKKWGKACPGFQWRKTAVTKRTCCNKVSSFLPSIARYVMERVARVP